MYTIHSSFMENAEDVLANLLQEVEWNPFTIHNKLLCRTGCFQGIREGENTPWLRCPSIEYQTIFPISPTIDKIRQKIKKEFGFDTNIFKIQKYENGDAGIYAHADKIIDLDENTPIFVYRVGTCRIGQLVHKETKETIEYKVDHNSLLVLPFTTNLSWKHGIKKDDTAFPSYSIVFRKSITFLHPSGFIFGKRTPFKTQEEVEQYVENSSSLPSGAMPWTIEKQRKEIVQCYREENNQCISLQEGLEMYSNIIHYCIFPF